MITESKGPYALTFIDIDGGIVTISRKLEILKDGVCVMSDKENYHMKTNDVIQGLLNDILDEVKKGAPE